ncbi:MAG: porin [Caldimonas sp.]
MSRTTRSTRAFLLAVAAMLLGAAGASAQTAILYGLVDVAGSRTKPVGGEHRWQLDSSDLQRSFLGVRGYDDLGGGLRAVYRLESYIRPDTGSAGRADGDPFWAREASVGLSGAFGTTVLGRTVSPLYLSTINFNPFGEGFGFSPSTRQYFGSSGAVLGDSRWNNSINYTNNSTDAPLRINFAANTAEGGTPSTSNGRNVGASASYITGPFAATLAVELIRNSAQPLPAGFNRQLAIQAGATYDFSFVRVYGQVGRVKTEADQDVQTILYQLGAAVPVGNSLILVAYGRSHLKSRLLGTSDRTASIAYDYFLSKNTDIYVAALAERLSFVSSGNAIAGGMRLRF